MPIEKGIVGLQNNQWRNDGQMSRQWCGGGGIPLRCRSVYCHEPAALPPARTLIPITAFKGESQGGGGIKRRRFMGRCVDA